MKGNERRGRSAISSVVCSARFHESDEGMEAVARSSEGSLVSV